MELTTQQKIIYEKIIDDVNEVKSGDIFLEHSFISLKGPAGTGKTFLSRSIVSELLDQGFKIVIVAPTHQATKVIKNTINIEHNDLTFGTIHSLLSLKPGPINYETGEQKFVRITDPNKRSKLSMKKFDICIADESSQISTEIFGFLKEEMLSNKRIKSFLFIGDPYQLLPVGEETGKHSIYDNPVINHYELKELIRNPDMDIINFVTNIRNMIINKGTKAEVLEYVSKNEIPNKVILYDNKKDFVTNFIKNNSLGEYNDCIATFTNRNVDRYNNALRNFYVKDETCEIHPDEIYVCQETKHIDSVFMNSEIIHIKKFKEKSFYFEGTEIKGFECITDDNRKFTKIHSGYVTLFDQVCESLRTKALKSKNRKDWKKYYDTKDTFLDLKPPFSSTIHKLQGSSFRDIYVDTSDAVYVNDDFFLRLFYVATTRAKNKIHIYLPN